MSNYESALVPGLLQTSDYAEAIIRGMNPRVTQERLTSAIEARLTRQKLLTQSVPPQFHVILDEAVLRRNVGGSRVMRSQLERIAERANLPNVVVQVIPFVAGPHPGLNSTFILLDFPEPALSSVIFVEGLVGNLYLDRPGDIGRYRDAFQALADFALTPDDSIRFLAAEVESHS
jgi:hypothetical protein